ncbi:MAG TPA: hypothetical protein VK072_04420 [Candidatus Avamphibacillus sp.]|nr:hypothetical protein [Candidatus Avamphibacillus sp.]
MKEQELYKKVLKKIIDATENNKIKTTDEVIQTLIFELTNKTINNQNQKAHF